MPDLRQCSGYKDFGRGFYLTTSREQAENFARLSTKKAIANGIVRSEQRFGVISVFRTGLSEGLMVRMYPDADREWLRCIVGHRKSRTFPDTVRELRCFDVIAGKIANDNTNATITAYMAGVFGGVESEQAQELCISLLLPERLQDQFCFRTAQALRCLTFVESEQIWR